MFVSLMNGLLGMYPSGMSECVEEVLSLLSELKYSNETNNELHESLLQTRMLMRHDLMQLTETLDELKYKNSFVVDMLNNPLVEASYERVEEAMDAGVLRLSSPRYPYTVTAAGVELAEKLSHSTTTNIMLHTKHQNLSLYTDKIHGNRRFLFNSLMSFCEATLRIVRSIQASFT